MVDYNTGQITWPAVFSSRLSRFGMGLVSDDSIPFGDIHARVQFHTEPDRVEPPGNVMFELRSASPWSRPTRQRQRYDGTWVRLVARFDLERFEVLSCMPAPGKEQLFGVTEIQRQLEQRPQQCKDRLREALLEPFKYKRNRSGLKAHQMLPSGVTRCTVQLHRRKGQPFLVPRY